MRALPEPAETASHYRRLPDRAGFGFGSGVPAGLWSHPSLWAAACVVAGVDGFGRLRAFRVAVAHRGCGHACAHHNGGRGAAGSTTRARSAAGRDPRTIAGRSAAEDHRVVGSPSPWSSAKASLGI